MPGRPARYRRDPLPVQGQGDGPPPGLVGAMERIGDRWVLLIVGALLDGPARFGDLGSSLGVAPNILTARLRQLEQDGLVVARPYSERPVRHEYSLTGAGRELADAIALLADWGARRRGASGDAPFHAACGTRLEVRPWCPTCDRVVEPDEPTTAHEL